MKYFTYIVIAIVAIAIIAGFFILGTPKEERMRRFDETRVSHLQEVQWQVISYWQSKDELPENLSLLINETQGTRPPADPETSAAYEYQILDAKKLTFELCADFKTESSVSKKGDRSEPIPAYGPYGPYGPEPVQWNWPHGIGRTCFERTIDPDIYKPIREKSID